MIRPKLRAVNATTPIGSHLIATSPLHRDCPKCGAKRGYRCLSLVELDFGRRIKTIHKERSLPRTPKGGGDAA